MNIISAENFKMRKNASLKVLTIVCAVGLVLFTLLMKIVIDNANAADMFIGFGAKDSPFNFIQFNNIITICCGVFAGTFVVAEFDKGTIRNSLTTGTSKPAYYLAKLYAQLIVCIFLTLFSMAVFMLATTVFIGWGGDAGSDYILKVAAFTGAMLVQFFSYSSLFLMTAFLVRGIGGVIGISIAYITLEGVIAQLLLLTNNNILTKIAENMPGMILGNMSRYADNGMILTGDFAKTLIPAVIIIVVANLIGLFTFVKRDVK